MSIIRDAALLLVFGALSAAGLAPQQSSDSPVLGADLPLYPALARQAKTEGKVEVQVETGTDGKVISAVAVSGPGILRQAAADNAKTWRFAPGRSEVTVVYEFKIEGKAETNDPYYKYGKIIFLRPNSVEVDFFPLILVRD
ncbi:MAG: energy transducer TonB [Candidatus Sulfotelmatobacter sp.]